MSTIRIRDAKVLSIYSITSYKTSQRQATDAEKAVRETVLTITKKDGEEVTLVGTRAEAALAILHQHGC